VFEKSVKNLQRGEGQAAVTIEEFIIVSKEMIPQLIINKHDNFDKVIKDANSKKNFFDFIGALDKQIANMTLANYHSLTNILNVLRFTGFEH
jgi:hypothetical protein